jgi:Ca-activated chloride channel homolog
MGLRITRMFVWAAVVTGFLVLVSVRAHAQDVAGSPPVFQAKTPRDPKPADTQSHIRVQSPLVTTPVTVINSSGDFVSDLDQKEFQILDNGVPQRIERFEVATDPLALVIVVQTDNSLQPLLDQIRPLGPLFSDLMLGPNGQAALLSFSDKIAVLQDFSSDGDHLAATLKHLEALGDKKRLNDAMARAIAMLEARPKTQRRVIVVFSDGYDKGSESDRADVIRRATADEVTIYGLRLNPAEALLEQKPQDQPFSPLDANVARPLPPGIPPTATNSNRVWETPTDLGSIIGAAGEIIRSEVSRSTLEYYAAYTGGVYYGHWSKNALQEQLSRTASEVHSQYEIAYAPNTLADIGFHRIKVEVAEPGLKVRARAGYFYEKP